MQTYFLKRLGLLIFTLWGITLVSFLILQFAPGSPLEMKLSQDRGGAMGTKGQLSNEALEMLKKQYNLDKPVLVRYGLWIRDLARFDFGTSYTDYRKVSEKILERLPVSLVFGISSIFVALLIGIPLGLIAGAYQNSFLDRSIAVFVIALYALPTYVLGILLLTFFGGGEFFDLFPIYGIQSDNFYELNTWQQILDRAHHFVLPCLCYSVVSLAFISQQQRASILDVLGQDYIRTARAKGVNEKLVLFKHAFRNALIPIVTIAGAMIPAILGGGVIIEKLFSIPGLGLLAYEALLQRDYPTIMATFTISAFLSLLGIFLADLCYVLVDPRISFEGR